MAGTKGSRAAQNWFHNISRSDARIRVMAQCDDLDAVFNLLAQYAEHDRDSALEAATAPKVEEGYRQMILLAIAELALSRPGWDYALGEIAESFRGREMFEEFKRLNSDRVKAERAPLLPERSPQKDSGCTPST